MVERNFQIKLKNRLFNEQQEMDVSSFNQEILEAGLNILGTVRRKKEQLISQQTLSKIDERKEVRKKFFQTKSERIKQ
ncbi:hypothetical protein DPMN_065710 [Dreissena polymorpha]|uniref:Uncharacterized protein n=1 Tax=Dreissena polymorpha TaxID=45954 RepID=A0A9D4BRH6_DREPO|nr:hypothetical protein DPMN_065710 [Dreissena polymorpha]